MRTMNLYQKSGAVITLVFFIFIIVLAIINSPFAFNPPAFLPFINILFIYFSSVTVVYLAALGYLSGSNRTVLLLASGVLIAGSSAVVGELLFLLSGDTVLIMSLVSIGALLGSIAHFVNLILTTIGTNYYREHTRKVKLLVTYSAVVIFIIILTVISFLGEALRISVPGSVLVILPSTAQLGVVIFCGLTGIFFLHLWIREGSGIIFWYSLGLLLIALGHVSSLLQLNPGVLLAWAGWSAGYIADIFLIIAVLVAYRNRSGSEVPDT